MAEHWRDQGARRLHLVDLNGAVAGKPKNEAAIKSILAAVGDEIPVQIGGGIRDLVTIEHYLDRGISYVVIGTAAGTDPGVLRDACSAFPGTVIVGLGAGAGHVATAVWSELPRHSETDLEHLYVSDGSDTYKQT